MKNIYNIIIVIIITFIESIILLFLSFILGDYIIRLGITIVIVVLTIAFLLSIITKKALFGWSPDLISKDSNPSSYKSNIIIQLIFIIIFILLFFLW